MRNEGWVTTRAGNKFPLIDWLYHHKDVDPFKVDKSKLGKVFFSTEDDAVEFYYRKEKQAQGEK